MAPRDCRYTYHSKTQRLYLHILSWPIAYLVLPGLTADKVRYAQLLNDGSEIIFFGAKNKNMMSPQGVDEGTLTFKVPPVKPPVEVPVIEIMLK